MKSIVLLFFKILKIIFLSKKIYKLPKKSDILIFDNTGAEILKTLIPKNTSIEILFTRNERINILIFLKSIWKVGNLKENYIFEFISQVEPKIIITYIDNNLFYYSIKKHFPKIKFISIQNGKRDNVFFDKLQKNFETAEEGQQLVNNYAGKRNCYVSVYAFDKQDDYDSAIIETI